MMVRNISKTTACSQGEHHEKQIGRIEQSHEFLEAECKMELFDSIDMCLSLYDKGNARKRIQKALHKVKEERNQIEQDLRINFELAKARITESDFVCSAMANRIVAAMAMDRVTKSAEKLERINCSVIRLKQLRDDVDSDIIALDNIDNMIADQLLPLTHKQEKIRRTYTDQELLRHLSRTLLKKTKY